MFPSRTDRLGSPKAASFRKVSIVHETGSNPVHPSVKPREDLRSQLEALCYLAVDGDPPCGAPRNEIVGFGLYSVAVSQ